MRIRKRAVPLPFSLLSPVQLPPNFPLSTSQPSDRRPDLAALSSDEDLRRLIPHDRGGSTPQPPPQRSIQIIKACKDEQTKKEQREDSNKNTSKQPDLGAVPDNGVQLVPLPPTPSNQTRVSEMKMMEERWCDGDKCIPLKKRKASFEMNGMVVTGESKMTSKTNKKCPRQKDDDSYEEHDDDDDDDFDSDAKNKRKSRIKTKKTINRKNKKKKKGGSIMEGSRCSRVNGRGWRCMQPTLVGYSLCEHHLGKGRLRTMSNVRAHSRKLPSSSSSTTNTAVSAPTPHDEEKSRNDGIHFGEGSMIIDDEDEDEEEKDSLVGVANSRKRMRVGMVKARSLSSLLCQPDTAPTATTTSLVKIGVNSAIEQREIK